MDDILLQVRKPARYIGREWNLPEKDFAKASVRFALCFPDMYEIGMSNLGVRIMYDVLNSIPGVGCERFFSPADDYAALVRSGDISFGSLETASPPGAFDMLGFSLGSELAYTNVLHVLSLGNIPLLSAERTPEHPFVFAGGPCTLNPEPLHAFIDAFMIGEWDECFPEVLAVYRRYQREYKAHRVSREEILRELACLEGVYVPGLYDVRYDERGSLAEFTPRYAGLGTVVKKRYVRDLNRAPFPVSWLVPYVQIVHDRISLEVMRGCPNRCRFCQGRVQYHPLRLRSAENLMGLARRAHEKTGYEEITLCGLSVSDYPGLERLVKEMVDYFQQKAVAVSFPSIKANSTLVSDMFETVARIKKPGLTFAPEAGTARLRKILAKNFDEDVFMAALTRAYQAGYQRVKLYYMIGLPGERDEDIDGIIALTERVACLRREAVPGKPQAHVNVSVNTFIPKPHTAFQWFGMDSRQAVERKRERLRRRLQGKKTTVHVAAYETSFIEGVLSRGDRRLSRVILRAYTLGARFDGWEDHFSLERWLRAFQDEGIDPHAYIAGRPCGSRLPWDFIDTGMDKQKLREEFRSI